MLTENLKLAVKSFPNFPKEGILFRDISPILSNPDLFQNLIETLANYEIFDETECLISIDARGFIFGSALALYLKKPMILARKKNKLPGELVEKSYGLEYGMDSLSIQKDTLSKFKKFVIIDDLLATGGTAKCVGDLLKSVNKEVLALVVIIELLSLKGKEILPFPVYSQLKYD